MLLVLFLFTMSLVFLILSCLDLSDVSWDRERRTFVSLKTYLAAYHCSTLSSPVFILLLSPSPVFFILTEPFSQLVKNLPAMQETWVQSLDPLEKEMATHSSILAWRVPWTEEPGGLQFMESQKSLSN